MNRTNSGLSGRGIFFILSAVMMLGVCGTAAAAPTVRTVVHTGQQAAGVEGGMLWDYFSYSVGLDNAGGVAFYGSARSDTAVAAGVWQVDQAGEASLVLRWGQAMPELGPDVMLDYTSPPLRYGLAGHIGLSIRAERPDGSGISGQWLIHGGTREMLAQYQGPAPMAGPDATIWDLGEFSRATIDGKVVVVTRTVDDSSHQWMASMYDGGNWQVLATRPAEATNSYAEQFWNLAVNDAGQVAMVAGDHPVYVASKTPVELLFHDGDSLDAVYRTGDVAADTDGVFTNSRDVNHSLNAGGELAYRGNFLRPGAAEADEGVWLFREAVSQLVLTTGEAAPGCAEGESADWLDNPFLTDGGEVYLHARLTGPTVTTTNDNVLWVSRHGEMEVLLREGSLLADGSTLVRFRRPHINTQGQVAIDAVTSEGDGVWLVDGQGVLRRILLVGDAIDLDPSEAVADLREVVRVDFGLGSGARGGHFESQPPAWAINDRGEVLLRVGLADGTEALVVAMIPEPSAGLAALGLVALAMKRAALRVMTWNAQTRRGQDEIHLISFRGPSASVLLREARKRRGVDSGWRSCDHRRVLLQDRRTLMDKGTPHSHTPPAFALGVDYGTNSVRALIVDAADGRELGAGVYEYPSGEAGILLDSRDPNLARQNPADYMEGFAAAVRAAVDAAKQDKAFNPQQVVGIGVDTTGSTPLPVDAQGRPLALDERFKDNLAAHAWLWKDHTSYAEAAEITAKARERGEPYLAKCGGAYSSEWFWSKILHCKRTAPEVFAAAHSWVELADFIPAYITGKTRPEAFVRGICAAGHKAMYGQAWGGLPSKEFLASLDPDLAALRGRLFNAAVPSDHVAGKLTAEIADRVGLPTGIPVAVGALDADLGAVGAGIGPGALVKIIGTSTCDMMVAGMDDASMDVPGLCGVVPGSIVPGMLGLEAGQSAVGDIFNWFVSHLTPGKYGAGGEAHEKLTAEAEKLAPGQSGLVALDWNNGNRTVLVDPLLSGLLVGQTLHTTAAEVYRALIEATAFGALTIINRMEEHGVKVDSVINCGGIAEKSPLTMQIYADVTNRPMRLSRSGQTCALGAAIFGAVVGGAHASVGEAQKKMTGLKDIAYRPRPEAVATYAALYRVYKALHDAFGGVERAADLSGVMKELIAIRDRVRKQVG